MRFARALDTADKIVKITSKSPMVSEWVESGTTLALIFVERTLPMRTSDALHHYWFLSHASYNPFYRNLSDRTIRVLSIVTFTRRSLSLLGKLDVFVLLRHK